jgi:hypothetical protein
MTKRDSSNTEAYAFAKAASFLAMIICLAIPSMASASPTTRTFDFSASNFIGAEGSTPPADTVAGSVTISFDPDYDYGDLESGQGVTAGIQMNSLTIPLDSDVSFLYYSASGNLLIGGSYIGTRFLAKSSNDFLIVFGLTNPAPTFGTMGYTREGFDDFYITYTGQVTATAVPVPAAVWLLGSGLLGLVGINKRIRHYIE